MARELLLIPGPTFLHPTVIEAMKDSWSHVSPEFRQAFLKLLELTRYLFRCEEGQPYAITGSATLGMEAVATSLFEPSDKVLALDTGYFARRFEELARLRGAHVEALRFSNGEPADPKRVDEKLSEGGFKALLVTHVDTSNGVMNDVKVLSAVGRRHDVLVVVDSVCGVGGAPLDFDGWGLDVALTGSQKAIAAPAGATLICLSPRALEALMNRTSPIPSYYLDLSRWRRVMEDPSIYLATPAVQVMLGLHAALHIVKEEGLEKRWKRHQLLAQAFRAGVEAYKLPIVALEKGRADTMTALHAPDGRGGEIQRILREQHRVHVARGLYEDRDRLIRVAHFGNIGANEVATALLALGLTLKSLGHNVDVAGALHAAMPSMVEAPPPP